MILPKNGAAKNGQRSQTHRAADPKPLTGVRIILEHFREHFRPAFKRGTAIVTADGEEVPMLVGTAAPTSPLIDRLMHAADAPTCNGYVKRGGLPGFYRSWARVAWGDLLTELPDEDDADLGAESPPGEEFRRLVRAALLCEVTLADTIGHTAITQVERRSLIGWCCRFAKPGPWRAIRSKCCWCKREVRADGEEVLMVAIHHDLFEQVQADRRLRAMGAKAFARRAAKYGVGRARDGNRPHGIRALVLEPDFIIQLTTGIPDEGHENLPKSAVGG